MTNKNSLLLVACLLAAFLPAFLPVFGSQTHAGQPTLRTADALDFANRSEKFFDAVEDGSRFTLGKIVAFEEHNWFVYVAGGDPAVMLRRVILLKPSTIVIDDQVRLPDSSQPVRWLLESPGEAKIAGHTIRIAEPKGKLSCQTLLPEKAAIKSIGQTVEIASQGNSPQVRFLNVIDVSPDDQATQTTSELAEKNGRLLLTVATAEQTFSITLPPQETAGTIAINKAGGEVLMEYRPLPSGILPYGPQGVRLLDRWDSAYREGRRPGWDVGRPATELKKAVDGGTLVRGRAVVLGCGTGTNAIYLAGKGFDVTAIDIAPTALARAEKKAQEAGVKVRWLVADVLATPKLQPFDVIFDRGCYHGVRRGNAKGYVETLRRLSHAGTQALILAGNANEARHYGPPRVKEEEIRGDFSELFDFQWLKEIKFDSRDPNNTNGPMAWSILLRRKGDPAAKLSGGPLQPCIIDPTIDADKIPRFGCDSPFDKDYQPPVIKNEKRLWANSFLWSKAPEFVVEEWITDKPKTDGKYVLIEFWATWCPPCRRSLSLLNELHRKFGDELVVIGVCEETAADVRKLNEKHPEAAKIEFYCAVDTQKRMKDKLGVWGIPHIVILEPEGYVIWEGFPLQEGFELTEEIIEKILDIGRKLKEKQ